MNSIGPKAQSKSEVQSSGFASSIVFGLQRWDLGYVAVVLVTVLVASRVGGAVHAGQEVDTCLLASSLATVSTPACASALIDHRGHYDNVLTSVTNATRIAR